MHLSSYLGYSIFFTNILKLQSCDYELVTNKDVSLVEVSQTPVSQIPVKVMIQVQIIEKPYIWRNCHCFLNEINIVLKWSGEICQRQNKEFLENKIKREI